MAYATQADLLQQEGEDTVYAAFDRDRDGELGETDTAGLLDALENASETMDSYLSQRYDLPLAQAPAWSKRICIDLALYFGSRSADALTKELRRRYEDALTLLSSVSKGIVGLGLPKVDEPVSGEDGLVRDGLDMLTADRRLFTRKKMRFL